MITLRDIVEFLRVFGFPTFVALAIAYGFVTERIVSGVYVKRLLAERDEALDLLATRGAENERDLRDLRQRFEGRVQRHAG